MQYFYVAFYDRRILKIEKCKVWLFLSHYCFQVLARGGPLSKSLRFNSSNPDCPINELPTTYAVIRQTSDLNKCFVLTDQHSGLRLMLAERK